MNALPVAALAILALVLFAAPASAASFDCAQAETNVEKMICRDSRLSKMDEVLGERYRWALSQSKDTAALRSEQRNWLQKIRDVCFANSCLEIAYRNRITEVTEIGCAWAGLEADPVICAETELGRLEVLMGDRYARALAKGNDPEAVKAEQQAWLRDVRDACTDRACLTAAHKDRIAQLTKIGWMTDEKARAICDEITKAMNDVATLDYQSSFSYSASDDEKETWAKVRPDRLHTLRTVLRIDYDADGKTETLGRVHAGGTCGFVEVGDIEIGINQSFPPQVDPGRFQWLNWGSPDEHYYTIRDEPIIVAENLVSWLDPAGVKRAVCVVEKPTNTEAARRKTISGDNPAPCEAIEKDAVRFEPWETEITVSAKSYDSQIPSYSDEARASEGQAGDNEYFTTKGIVLDMDRDGEDDQLITIEWSSSGGCGAGGKWIAEVDPETKTILNSPITELPPGGIFMHDGIPYLYADGSVQTFAKGDFVEQCRIITGETVQYEVADFFPVETWAQ